MMATSRAIAVQHEQNRTEQKEQNGAEIAAGNPPLRPSDTVVFEFRDPDPWPAAQLVQH